MSYSAADKNPHCHLVVVGGITEDANNNAEV